MTKLPAGPRGRLRPTLQFLKDPMTTATRWRERYGDPFTMHAVNGTVVMTAEPENIRAIFAADPDLFSAFGTRAITPVTGPASLLALSGPRHRRERRLLMPPFHGDRMRAYADIIADSAQRRFSAAAKEGRFDAQRVAQTVSLEVILRAVLGLEADDVDEFANQVIETVEGVSPFMLFFPFLQVRLGGLSPWDRFEARFANLDRILQDHVQWTRAKGGGEDILSLMLAARYEDGEPMADSDIRDELRTLVVAGHETTALSLAWAIDAIHRNPEVQERLLAEVDEAEDSPEAWGKLPYLDAVCKETLRIRPILTEVLRTLEAPWQLAGYDLPKGVAVCASIHLTHFRPDLYPDPNRFRPERFEERKFSPFEYLPFGGGSRRCLGAAFAHFEMKVVLAAALRAFRFRLESDSPPPVVRRNFTMAPGGGVWVTAENRDRLRKVA